MNIENDTLSSFEIKENNTGTLFYVVCWIYGLLILSFIIYSFWPFSNRLINQISVDSEMQILTFIHVIYPSIALFLFLIKKKLGWVLIILSSIVNATYGIFDYGSDFVTGVSLMDAIKDKMIFYFLGHLIIIALIFRNQLIQYLDVSRKFLLYAIRISIILSALLLLFLMTMFA